MQTHKFVLYKYCLLVKEIVFLISLIITFLSITKKGMRVTKTHNLWSPLQVLESIILCLDMYTNNRMQSTHDPIFAMVWLFLKLDVYP